MGDQWKCYAKPAKLGGKRCEHVNAKGVVSNVAGRSLECCESCGATRIASDDRRLDLMRDGARLARRAQQAKKGGVAMLKEASAIAKEAAVEARGFTDERDVFWRAIAICNAFEIAVALVLSRRVEGYQRGLAALEPWRQHSTREYCRDLMSETTREAREAARLMRKRGLAAGEAMNAAKRYADHKLSIDFCMCRTQRRYPGWIGDAIANKHRDAWEIRNDWTGRDRARARLDGPGPLGFRSPVVRACGDLFALSYRASEMARAS